MNRAGFRLPALIALMALAACTAVEPGGGRPASGFDRAAAVAAIRAAGAPGPEELDVQPLRDPRVEDLRERALELEDRGDLAGAARELDAALAIQSQDPALLQERAEIALLQGRLDEAERLASQAIERGSQVGPLCRRHWETVAQVRGARAPASPPGPTAAQARQQRDACTVNAPPRY